MTLRVDNVGSMLRPPELVDAVTRHEAGDLGDEIADRRVLRRPQAVVAEVARLVAGHGVHELRRAEHGADVVDTERHASSLLTR